MGSQRWPSSSGGSNWSPGLLDRAETFTESDVTVDGSVVSATSGGIGFDPGATTATDNYSLDGDYTGTGWKGTEVRTKAVISEVTVAPASGQYQTGAEGVRVERESDGEVIARETGLNLSGGESYTLTGLELEPYTTYNIEVDATGGHVVDPESEMETDIAVFQPGGMQVRALDSVSLKASVLSGSAVVNWPMPDDVAEWDSLYYEATEGGGSVSVYAVDASTGDRLTGPLDDPSDISGVPNTTNVAFEVALERPSEAEDPRLESIYRRRKIT